MGPAHLKLYANPVVICYILISMTKWTKLRLGMKQTKWKLDQVTLSPRGHKTNVLLSSVGMGCTAKRPKGVRATENTLDAMGI